MLCALVKHLLGNPLNRSPGTSRRTPAVRRVRPGLEALEDRTVPTIAFRPQVAGEAVIDDGSQNTALSSATVYLLFEGAYWGSTAGTRDEKIITTDALKILGSPFLSGLGQYTPSRGNVQATLGGTYRDAAPLPADFAPTLPNGQFNWTVLNARLQSAFANPGSGVPASAVTTPIYVILTDPNVPSGAGCIGYNEASAATNTRCQVWTTIDLWDPSTLGLISGRGARVGRLDRILGRFGLSGGRRGEISSLSHRSPRGWLQRGARSGAFDEDKFTQTLSHELVESMSGSVKVILPGAYADMGNQVADGEPESGQGYGYRLNGVLVQPYWSARDQAFIVPDGNRQQFTLEATTAGPYGLPRYTLVDQPATTSDDRVHLTWGASGGLRVALNGEVAQFDAAAVSSISVNTAGGDIETVSVAAVAPGSRGNATRHGVPPFKVVAAGGRILHGSSLTIWNGHVIADHRRIHVRRP
jgi:hypothetical protein